MPADNKEPAAGSPIISFFVPLIPVSVNQYWRRSGNRFYTNPKAKEFKQLVELEFISRKLSPTDQSVMVHITYYPKDKRFQDVDNVAKATLDSLKGCLYIDDKQVTELLIRRASCNKEHYGIRVDAYI